MFDDLNSNENSYQNMIDKLSLNKIISNEYRITKSKMEITIANTSFEQENEVHRGSNIEEFFDLLATQWTN